MKKIVVLFVSMLVLATTASAGNDKPIQVLLTEDGYVYFFRPHWTGGW